MGVLRRLARKGFEASSRRLESRAARVQARAERQGKKVEKIKQASRVVEDEIGASIKDGKAGKAWVKTLNSSRRNEEVAVQKGKYLEAKAAMIRARARLRMARAKRFA